MTRRDETRRDETRRACDRVVTSLLVLAACVSCSGPPAPGVIPETKSEVQSATPPKPSDVWYDPAATRHDFGLVLAGSDVIRAHTFQIANTSGRPVRVHGVANRKPCCGDVTPMAATVVEPGQSIKVAVRIKIGLAAGHVVHVAAIETDGGDDSGVDLITMATAHARVTVEEIDPLSGPLDPGHSRRIEYLIRSFGVEGNPPPPLDDRTIRCGVPAEWVGLPVSGVDAEAGLIEVRRNLAVTLPASSDPGSRSVSLELLDGGGAVVGRRWIGWEVASAWKTSPAGLVFTTDAQATAGRMVVVRCRDDHPFRLASATTPGRSTC